MEMIEEKIIAVAQLMFERNLTDITGGNISVRHDDKIYITPRYAGSRFHWRLRPEDIVIGPIDSDASFEHPSFSREGRSHLAVYRAFQECQSIIHAHPFYIMPFCAYKKPIEPVLRAARKFGVLKFIDEVEPYSEAQAMSIIHHLRGQEELMKTAAAAVLMPMHGIFLVGYDLHQALDALERINTNAWCLLARRLLSYD
jgi:L-fuculose-phosphate aldolase